MSFLYWIVHIALASLFLIYILRSTEILNFQYLSERKRDPSKHDIAPDFAPDAVTEYEVALFSTCVLAEFPNDGWTNEVIEMARVDLDPLKNCDENFTPFTVLGGNGTVWLNSIKTRMANVSCKARAIYYKDERHYNTSPWYSIGYAASKVVFDSDFVRSRCHKAENEVQIVEDFVHVQMWNAKDDGGAKVTLNTRPSLINDSKPAVAEEELEVDEKPSVFIFVLDSVSSSQALRSLPKTISLLEHEFEAINMKHVNKIGENSHPNGMAFLMGKLIVDIDRRVFGMGKEKAEWNETHACYRYLDDEPFILKEFTKKGYKSLMAEDWANGLFNYPECWGFKNKPATHYMRPFQIYYEENLPQSNAFMGENQCFEPHTFLFNYLTKFIEAYKESPKISLLWADTAHDDTDNLFHMDEQLFDYFREHREIFDKSYVFFMGDHGSRWGKVRDTWIGQREINNPMLFVSVPRHLRKQINPTLKENSNKLLTPFDIHASLVDILNDPHMGGLEGPGGLRGTSFFRPLPPGERSCRTLPIPIQYCLCQWKTTKSLNDNVNEEIGYLAVNLLNTKLKELQITDSCREFTFKEAIEVKTVDRTEGLTEIRFTTNECDAEFKTIVRVHRLEGRLLNVTGSDFVRWNSYGGTSCMDSRPSLRPLCCCKSNSRND